MNAYIQRQKLLELLRENYATGVNAKIFYLKEFYRYAERLRELRKDGWVFAKIKQPLGGHNFYRFWIARDVKNIVNPHVPKNASYWDRDGRMNPWKVKDLIQGVTKKILRYEFVGNNAIPITG